MICTIFWIIIGRSLRRKLTQIERPVGLTCVYWLLFLTRSALVASDFRHTRTTPQSHAHGKMSVPCCA